MATAAKQRHISRDAVEDLSRRFDEPDWLRDRRLEGWRLFEEAPAPDPLSDEWKRFDTERLSLGGLAPYAPHREAIAGRDGLPAQLRSIWDDREELAGRLVQHDSDVVFGHLLQVLAARGVIVSDLHSAARQHEAVVRKHLFSTVSPAEWKYLALHGALWSGGCLVHVPAGVEIELPIEYTTLASTNGLALFPHVLIVAEEHAKVTVVQEAFSPDLEQPLVVSGAVEIVAAPGAQVTFVDVQRWGRSAQVFSTMRARLARDASFEAVLLGLGGTMTRARLEALMSEEASRANLSGLFFGDSDQSFYYDTRQDHIAPHTQSDLLFKAALNDRASIIWDGVVDVRESASQASANQTSRNLLLSDKASASPTPILEISAFDVTSCSHGATVGPVDPEQLFYLEARGIPHDEAERMLVEGFYAEVLERVPSERLQQRVRGVIEAKLAAPGKE
jgi:Fe-S cluster assembly protein SufD